MKKILILICCLLFLSCGSKKKNATIERVVVDSTIVEKSVRERDTTIVVPASKAVLKVPISELTAKPIIKRQGQATITLKKENEMIVVLADCSELRLQLSLRDSLIKTLRSIKDTTVHHSPRDDTGKWYDPVLKTIGVVVLLLSILALICIVILKHLKR